MDHFFRSLLLDQRILFSVYEEDTRILHLTYGDVTYDLSLNGFVNIYPNRKKYTLQTAGLYYLACVFGDLPASFLREDIVDNYKKFKARNEVSKTDFVSLVLICVPSFLLTVIRGDVSSSSEEILKKGKFDIVSKKYKISRKTDDSIPGIIYAIIFGLGAITIVTTSILFVYVMRNRAIERERREMDVEE